MRRTPAADDRGRERAARFAKKRENENRADRDWFIFSGGSARGDGAGAAVDRGAKSWPPVAARRIIVADLGRGFAQD